MAGPGDSTQQLVALSSDLERMAELFVRLVKSARVREDEDVPGHAAPAAPGELLEVLVEGLVSRACNALDTIDALQKAAVLGNADRALRDRVHAAQHRLRGVAGYRALFAAQQPGPLHDVQRLLNRLEASNHASLVPAARTQTSQGTAEDALCAEALQAVV